MKKRAINYVCIMKSICLVDYSVNNINSATPTVDLCDPWLKQPSVVTQLPN